MNTKDVQSDLVRILKFSLEDLDKLSTFHNELLKFNNKYNLISKSTEPYIWERHILDSAQIVKYVGFEDGKSLSDMGSGAGFPGIILAIFNKNPKFHVKL
jgi:16S rRNA (guanine527-N7)-methyltransferase